MAHFRPKQLVDFSTYNTQISYLTGAIISKAHYNDKYNYVQDCDCVFVSARGRSCIVADIFWLSTLWCVFYISFEKLFRSGSIRMELWRFSTKMAAKKRAIPTVVSGTYKGKIVLMIEKIIFHNYSNWKVISRKQHKRQCWIKNFINHQYTHTICNDQILRPYKNYFVSRDSFFKHWRWLNNKHMTAWHPQIWFEKSPL